MVAMFLVPFALIEMIVAYTCFRRHPASRMPAVLMLLSAPLQVLSALFAGQILAAWHMPSSFDALGDGFDLLFSEIGITIGLVLLPVWFGVWMSIRVLFGGR